MGCSEGRVAELFGLLVDAPEGLRAPLPRLIPGANCTDEVLSLGVARGERGIVPISSVLITAAEDSVADGCWLDITSEDFLRLSTIPWVFSSKLGPDYIGIGAECNEFGMGFGEGLSSKHLGKVRVL